MSEIRMQAGSNAQDGLIVSVASSDPLITSIFQPYSFLVFALLRAVRVHRIAEKLADGPLTMNELTDGTAIKSQKLGRVLDLLIRFGFFSRDEKGRYCHNANSRRHLLDDSTISLIDFLGTEEVWKSWRMIGESLAADESAFALANGEETFPYIMKHAGIVIPFQMMLRGQTMVQSDAIRRAYDFSGQRRIVDVGGGNGKLICDILEDHRHAEGVLFDTPEVIRQIQDLVSRSPARPRLELVAGDFFRHVPSGSMLMLKLVLHDWQDEPASIILRNCRAALDRGGKLLVMEHLRTSDDLCFWDILDVAMMAIQRGRERTEAEYAALLQSAAFSVTQVRRASPVGMSVIEAVAA